MYCHGTVTDLQAASQPQASIGQLLAGTCPWALLTRLLPYVKDKCGTNTAMCKSRGICGALWRFNDIQMLAPVKFSMGDDREPPAC